MKGASDKPSAQPDAGVSASSDTTDPVSPVLEASTRRRIADGGPSGFVPTPTQVTPVSTLASRSTSSTKGSRNSRSKESDIRLADDREEGLGKYGEHCTEDPAGVFGVEYESHDSCALSFLAFAVLNDYT